MNLSEFKAWFEGYTENMSDLPNETQWARIQERISEIEDKPAPRETIIKEVERWRRHPWPWWKEPYITFSALCNSNGEAEWSSKDAFKAIGRAEYSA